MSREIWPEGTITVSDLKAFLSQLPDGSDNDCVTILIENAGQQWHFNVNEMAHSSRGYIILMHEKGVNCRVSPSHSLSAKPSHHR